MSNDVMDSAQRLADVLARENAALKRLDFAAAVALAPDKEAALTDLNLPGGEPPSSPGLIALCRQLGELVTENQTLLERAIAVQTRIVRIVARAGAPPPDLARYGGRNGRASSPASMALALSTRA